MEQFVLDTNVFFNLQNETGLGKKTEAVITSLTKLVTPLKQKGIVELLMPQSVAAEFLGFFDPIPLYVQSFMALMVIKSPDREKLSFQSEVFYKLIAETRARTYRGLQIAEEQLLLLASEWAFDSKKTDKKLRQQAVGPYLTKLRERYRHATRFNFLDSVEDLDLITLAKECDGFLVSSDEGLLRWGRIFGVRELPVALLASRLTSLQQRHSNQA